MRFRKDDDDMEAISYHLDKEAKKNGKSLTTSSTCKGYCLCFILLIIFLAIGAISTGNFSNQAIMFGSERFSAQDIPTTPEGAAIIAPKQVNTKASATQQLTVKKGANTNLKDNNTSKLTAKRIDKCEKQWRNDRLTGRCFGLTTHTELKDVSRTSKIIKSADECKELCCEMGEECVSWQFADGTKTCKVGGPVRMGLEEAGTNNWCEPHPPVTWNGQKVKSRPTSTTCAWGDALPTQCFGLGPERLGANKNRLTTAECAEACCNSPDCTMWQELPDRGCYFSGGDNYCDKYLGTFEGARKCVKGFCGGKEPAV